MTAVLGCGSEAKPGGPVASEPDDPVPKSEPAGDRAKNTPPPAPTPDPDPKAKPALERVLTGVADRQTAVLKDIAAGINAGDANAFRYRRGRAYYGLGKFEAAADDLALPGGVAKSPNDQERSIWLARALLWQLKAASDDGNQAKVDGLVGSYKAAFDAATALDRRVNFWSKYGAFGDPTREVREADAWVWLALEPPDKESGAAAAAVLADPTEAQAKRAMAAMWNPALTDYVPAAPDLRKRCLELVAAARTKLPKAAEEHERNATAEAEELREHIIKLGVASGDLTVGNRYAPQTRYFRTVVELFTEPAKR